MCGLLGSAAQKVDFIVIPRLNRVHLKNQDGHLLENVLDPDFSQCIFEPFPSYGKVGVN